jgi:hypothetical protein
MNMNQDMYYIKMIKNENKILKINRINIEINDARSNENS